MNKCELCIYEDFESSSYPCSICKHNKIHDTPEYEKAPEMFKDKNNDSVNHPSHYTQASVECFDIMIELFGETQVSSFCLCNAFTYLWRCEHKSNKLEDLRKAIWYLNKAVEILEK